MSFKDQVVLITGGASGIGAEAARTFSRAGARVVVSDISEETGQALVAEIQATGQQALWIQANVAVEAEVITLIQQTVATFGRIDIALNNAGIGGAPATTAQVQTNDWERVIAVNQTGVFWCMREELAQMEKQGRGCIVNVASVAGLRGLAYQLAYTASKHAVVGMTKVAALEYARQGIRINAVCPVFTKSPLLDQLLAAGPGMEAKLLRNIPVRRFGEPADVVNAITWLCAASSDFITGLVLPVDGGHQA
ncbi:MAG: glucose 1-dehydrogenase [Lewinellaceae bacterium]|nr:glucose 1-dehydrogenase [Lewinellaceae bacterium]